METVRWWQIGRGLLHPFLPNHGRHPHPIGCSAERLRRMSLRLKDDWAVLDNGAGILAGQSQAARHTVGVGHIEDDIRPGGNDFGGAVLRPPFSAVSHDPTARKAKGVSTLAALV